MKNIIPVDVKKNARFLVAIIILWEDQFTQTEV